MFDLQGGSAKMSFPPQPEAFAPDLRSIHAIEALSRYQANHPERADHLCFVQHARAFCPARAQNRKD
jgi:hypothetical protein